MKKSFFCEKSLYCSLTLWHSYIFLAVWEDEMRVFHMQDWKDYAYCTHCDRSLSEEECRLQITRESETQVTKTYCTYCEGRAIRTPKGSSNSFVSKQR